jgi:hypothetical protein
MQNRGVMLAAELAADSSPSFSPRLSRELLTGCIVIPHDCVKLRNERSDIVKHIGVEQHLVCDKSDTSIGLN